MPRIPGARRGVYVEFESIPNWDLAISSFENLRPKDPHQRIEVVAVRTDVTPGTGATVQRATVFVPEGKVTSFVKRLEAYALTTPQQPDEHRHHDLVDRISSLRLSTVRALWTDDQLAYPGEDEDIWWEVWLRKTDGREFYRFSQYANLTQIELGRRKLEFDDCIVVLAFTAARRLASSIDMLDDVSELRKAKELATFFVDQHAAGQAAWIRDLLSRIGRPRSDAVAVTVLDSGVTQGHPLLAIALDPADVHSVDPAWGGHDDGGATPGHGTQMCGLALYSDLSSLLGGRDPVRLSHRLESVKILPPQRLGRNPPDNYGAVTAIAVSHPEDEAPTRTRVFSMAVTSADQRDRGQPTSWSASIDALAIGRSFDVTPSGIAFTGSGPSRLFVISAGNVSKLDRDHLVRSDIEPVEDPAQAWNALTVGACTELAVIDDPNFGAWRPLAPSGELSPHSTTSVGFAPPWPVKPDVVMEGGNVGIDVAGAIREDIDDLVPLTTYHKPQEKPLITTWGTSAACAKAARLCARVMTEYPTLWPEAVRGLAVHSACWTPTMEKHLGKKGSSKHARENLLRRYGYGVPDESRALRSANDALTLIAQATLRPFSNGHFGDMHIYTLPWPGDVLEALGEIDVRLRVTLSYFIEPNPARRGWRARHRYQSHALRFEVKRPLESEPEFRKRINQLALDEHEERPDSAGDDDWFFGSRARERGCVHSDYWSGTAAALAERGMIGVHPVSGWWKEQPKRDRSETGVRYALIVSIETPGIETDIWTPVAQQIGVPIAIEVSE